MLSLRNVYMCVCVIKGYLWASLGPEIHALISEAMFGSHGMACVDCTMSGRALYIHACTYVAVWYIRTYKVQ